VLFGMDDAGRWALAHRARPAPSGMQAGAEAVEHVARRLLRRYGVVFWRLLEREADWLPPWRDLLRVYRQLERRGEIRGGRFVTGFPGEQYATPEAVDLLRAARRAPRAGETVRLSAADPLNLVGILIPGPRIPALRTNWVTYVDGLPVTGPAPTVAAAAAV
jgi:ATP-dependent Lhr-like helicase